MALTYEITEFVQWIIDKLSEPASQLRTGLKAVSYGPVKKNPDFPCAYVAGATKDREYATTDQYNVVLRANVVVLHGKVQDPTITRKEVETTAELVEYEANGWFTMDGTVIDSFVVRLEPGFVERGDDMLRATSLLIEALSREHKRRP